MIGKGRGPGGSLATPDFRLVKPIVSTLTHDHTKENRRRSVV